MTASSSHVSHGKTPKTLLDDLKANADKIFTAFQNRVSVFNNELSPKTLDPDRPKSVVEAIAGKGMESCGLVGLKAHAARLFQTVTAQVDALSQSELVRTGSFKSFCLAAGLAVGLGMGSTSVQAQPVIDALGMQVGMTLDQATRSDKAMPVNADWRQKVSERKTQEMAERQYRNSHVVKEMPATVIKEVIATPGQSPDDAKRMGAQVQRVDTAKGRYTGKVVEVASAHFVQDLGRQTVAVHEKGNFDLNAKGSNLDAGKTLRVQYQDGRGTISNIREHSKNQDRSR